MVKVNDLILSPSSIRSASGNFVVLLPDAFPIVLSAVSCEPRVAETVSTGLICSVAISVVSSSVFAVVMLAAAVSVSFSDAAEEPPFFAQDTDVSSIAAAVKSANVFFFIFYVLSSLPDRKIRKHNPKHYL